MGVSSVSSRFCKPDSEETERSLGDPAAVLEISFYLKIDLLYIYDGEFSPTPE